MCPAPRTDPARFWSSAGLAGNQANAFKKAKKNFKNPYDQTTMESSVPEGPRYEGDRRMVLNLRYRPAPPLAMKPSGGRIVFEMMNNGFSEVIYVDFEGEVHYYAA